MDGVGYSTTLQSEILKHAIATHVSEKKRMSDLKYSV